MDEGQLPPAGISQRSSRMGCTVLLVENDANLRSLLEMLLRPA